MRAHLALISRIEEISPILAFMSLQPWESISTGIEGIAIEEDGNSRTLRHTDFAAAVQVRQSTENSTSKTSTTGFRRSIMFGCSSERCATPGCPRPASCHFARHFFAGQSNGAR